MIGARHERHECVETPDSPLRRTDQRRQRSVVELRRFYDPGEGCFSHAPKIALSATSGKFGRQSRLAGQTSRLVFMRRCRYVGIRNSNGRR